MNSSNDAFAAQYGMDELKKLQLLGVDHPQGRALYRLRLEAEEIQRNPKPTVCEVPPWAGQERQATHEKRETLAPEKPAFLSAPDHGKLVDTKPVAGRRDTAIRGRVFRNHRTGRQASRTDTGGHV